MRIDKLPIGTKLMWDAPLLFEGYDNSRSLDKSKILYTAIISKKVTNINQPKGVRVKTGIKNNWMGYEQEHLRLPTKEELEIYKWPEL